MELPPKEKGLVLGDRTLGGPLQGYIGLLKVLGSGFSGLHRDMEGICKDARFLNSCVMDIQYCIVV